MYYVMQCFSPKTGDLAMLSYQPDHPRRSWASGNKFSTDPVAPPHKKPPSEPVRVAIKPGYAGVMAEFWDVPVPLMTKRLYRALQEAGVSNIDAYEAEIIDPATKAANADYVAFNLVGKVAAANLEKTRVAPGSAERKIAMDIDSLVIDESAAHGLLLFRLAESVNAIVAHERVKRYLEEHGIDTLTFVEPQDWAG